MPVSSHRRCRAWPIPRSTTAAVPLLVLGLTAAALLGTAAPSRAQGNLLLVGGGAEGADSDTGSWSWDPYRWFVERAATAGPNGGNGRIAILDYEAYPQCAQPNTGYCAYFLSLGAVEAQALHVSRRCRGEPACLDANDPATYQAIRRFDAVWFRGGDQARYVSEWADTVVESAVSDLFRDGGAAGGTSAGAMILSSVTSVGDATSYEATSDPYHPRIDLSEALFGGPTALTAPVLVDTHFTTRARLGRLATFLDRWAEDHAGQALLGVGIDEHTALTVTADGLATVRGEGAVSFLQALPDSERRLEPGRPPYVAGLRLDQLTHGFVFDLGSRTIHEVAANAAPAEPVPAAPAYGNALVDGASAALVRLGERWIRWRGDQDLYEGNLLALPGFGVLDNGVISTLLEDDTGLREVRTGGPQWALAGPLQHGLAVYLDGFDGDAFNRVFVAADETLRLLPPAGSPEQSAVLLDCHGMEWVARSTADPDGNGRTRQSVALTPCRAHLLNSQLGPRVYDAAAHWPR